ncbi:hypothetical protein ACOSQ4_032967 [Xanthoceras sorbifolium]
MITALIKYEILPDFCYGCGFIGHSFRECHNSEVRKSIMEGVEPKFGLWLRASPLDRSNVREDVRNRETKREILVIERARRKRRRRKVKLVKKSCV